MRKKLTAKAVERLKAPTKSGKQEVAWDTELTGFGVLLSGVTSRRATSCSATLPGGSTRRVTIGDVAELDLAKARDEAADVAPRHAPGRRPQAQGGRRRHAAAGARGLSAARGRTCGRRASSSIGDPSRPISSHGSTGPCAR